MESKKSMSPILIVILSVLGTCLVGFLVYYGVNYFKGEDVDVSSSNGEIENREDTSQLIGIQAKAYNSLITIDKSYGFYFNKNISIDNISDYNMIIYALNNYTKENKISLSSDLTCLEFETEYCKDVTFPTASSEQIQKYIKNKFNTSRLFELTPENIPDQFIDSLEHVLFSFYNGYCNYDFDKKVYSFGTVATGGMRREIHTKLIKTEEDGDKLYFYDKAFVEEDGQGYISLMSYLPDETSPVDNEIFSYDIEDTKKYDEIKVTTTNGNDSYDVNADYIFEKYSDKLNTYKHTFKKVNGNYYWISSEIVK